MFCKINSKWCFLAWVGVLAVAFAVRWVAAREAYPVPGDGGHFVQWGVALAHGHAKLNTYWSQGMVLAAAGAERLGVDPKRTLQGISFVAGMLVVLLFGGITGRLAKSGGWGLVGGLWAATNLTMVKYSIEGYSEMAYMALLMGAVYVALGGMPGWKRDLAAGVLLGLGGWFKGLDAAVAACAYALWRWAWGGRWRWDWRLAAVVPTVAFVVLLPLCAYTYSETGQFAPGSKGGGNFLLGLDWKDSKVVYAAEPVETRTYAEAFRALPRQVVGNVHDMFRLANEQLFTRGVRMGTIWFTLLGAALAVSLGKGRGGADGCNRWMLPVSLMGCQLALMSLAFVHDRILAPTLPWVVLAGLLGVEQWFGRRGGSGRGAVLCVFTAYCAVFASYSLHASRTESAWWRYGRIKRVGECLLGLGMDERDVVMHYGPQLSIETHHGNPLLMAEVPFGSIEEVGKVAAEKGVRFAAISDTWRGHWPIAAVAAGEASPPAGWRLRKTLVFEEEEETGAPGERISIFEVATEAAGR